METNTEFSTPTLSQEMLVVEQTKEPNSRWLDNLPYPKIYMPYGTGGDSNTGDTLTLNWYRWNGSYDKDKKVLTTEAAKTEFTEKSGEYVYDTRFATINADSQIKLNENSPDGFKPIPTHRMELFSNWITFNEEGHDDIPLEKDGHKLIFRGVNDSDWKKYIEEGKITPGDIVGQIRQEGQIFFAPEPNMPFGFAANRGQFDMASFDHPSYLISVKWPEDGELNRDQEVVVKRPIPNTEIVHVYEIKPAVIKTGHIPDVIVDDKHQYMALPSLATTSYNGPKGVFMYREIPADNLKNIIDKNIITTPVDSEPTILKTDRAETYKGWENLESTN